MARKVVRKATELEMHFGPRLQRVRRRQGFSQTRLARESGIPLGSIRNWERSKRTPLFDAVVAIAKALNVSLGELGGWEPHPEQQQQGPHAEGDTGRRRRSRGR